MYCFNEDELRDLLSHAWNGGCNCQAEHQGYSWLVLVESRFKERKDLKRPADQWVQRKQDVQQIIDGIGPVHEEYDEN